MSDIDMLKTIKAPEGDFIEKCATQEFTFLGNEKKPDFAKVEIFYIPNKKLIELKSLKFYFYQFRDKLYSYESIINVIYDDLIKVYEPKELMVFMNINIRGGIGSDLVRGTEYFEDWKKIILLKRKMLSTTTV